MKIFFTDLWKSISDMLISAAGSRTVWFGIGIIILATILVFVRVIGETTWLGAVLGAVGVATAGITFSKFAPNGK